MSSTVKIVRNLLAVHSCRSVFSLKYCTSHKSDKDSGVIHEVNDKSGENAFPQKNNTYKQGSDVKELKQETKTPEQDGKLQTSFISNAVESDEVNKGNLSLRDSKNNNLTSAETQPSSSDSDSASSDHEAKPTHGNTFKKFMDMVESGAITSKDEKSMSESKTFPFLLRKSPFIELGDPVNKLVLGEINIIVDQYAYIDFGWKFPAVCLLPRSTTAVHLWRPGSKVILKIKDLELCTRFLGDKKYTSLLEADCEFVSFFESDKTIEPE